MYHMFYHGGVGGGIFFYSQKNERWTLTVKLMVVMLHLSNLVVHIHLHKTAVHIVISSVVVSDGQTSEGGSLFQIGRLSTVDLEEEIVSDEVKSELRLSSPSCVCVSLLSTVPPTRPQEAFPVDLSLFWGGFLWVNNPNVPSQMNWPMS